MSNNQSNAPQHPVFNLDYRAKKNGNLDKLDKDEEAAFLKKCGYFSQMTLAQFEQNNARPRIWKGDGPGRPPTGLSEDITDGPLYRMNFTRKMRVFAYRDDNVFFVVWIDAKHKTG